MAIKTKIAGVTFNNRQTIISVLDEGETLYLRDMASARFPEEIGVFTSYGDRCGSISKDLAVSIREQYPDFETLNVTVLQVTGGGDKNYGCNIEIDGDGDIEHYEPAASTSAPRRQAPRRAAQKKAAKSKKTALYVVLALAVLCAIVAVYALVTNQGGGALRAGAVSAVLFVAFALLLRKKR